MNKAKRVELTGEKVFDAPQARVYDALHDPVILRQAIPGVQTLTMQGDGRAVITATLKVGPLRPTFSGAIDVYNADRPSGYSLRGEASGAGGSVVRGNVHVALAAVDLDTTNLAFHVTTDLTGPISSFEGVKLDVTARTLIAEFFSRLQSILDGEPAESAEAVHRAAAPGSAGSARTSPGPEEVDTEFEAAERAERQFPGVRAVPYQPPRYPPQSKYPDFDPHGEPAGVRPENASTTDATGGLVVVEPPHEVPPPAARYPGNLPQTPYSPAYRLGYEVADTAVYDGSGSGVGRWFMVVAGLAAIALLLNGGFSGMRF